MSYYKSSRIEALKDVYPEVHFNVAGFSRAASMRVIFRLSFANEYLQNVIGKTRITINYISTISQNALDLIRYYPIIGTMLQKQI